MRLKRRRRRDSLALLTLRSCRRWECRPAQKVGSGVESDGLAFGDRDPLASVQVPLNAIDR